MKLRVQPWFTKIALSLPLFLNLTVRSHMTGHASGITTLSNLHSAKNSLISNCAFQASNLQLNTKPLASNQHNIKSNTA